MQLLASPSSPQLPISPTLHREHFGIDLSPRSNARCFSCHVLKKSESGLIAQRTDLVMNMIRRIVIPALLTVIASSSAIAQTQAAQAQSSVSKPQTLAFVYSGRVKDLVDRIQSNSDRLQEDIDRALDSTRLDGSDREDKINEKFKEFRRAADRLEDRINDDDPPEGQFRELFRAWQEAETLMQRNPRIASRFSRQMETMRKDLDELRSLIGRNNWRRR